MRRAGPGPEPPPGYPRRAEGAAPAARTRFLRPRGPSMSVPLLDSAVSLAYPIVTAIAGVGGAALAIVACTLALRALLIPLTLRVIRGERARAALAPRLAELNRKHRKDPERLRTELAGLYRSAGISPYAGFLPALLQAPFFLVTYRLFVSP